MLNFIWNLLATLMLVLVAVFAVTFLPRSWRKAMARCVYLSGRRIFACVGQFSEDLSEAKKTSTIPIKMVV